MGIPRRFWGLLRGRRLDRDLQAEIEAHLGMREEANLAAGLGPEAARRAAARRLGNELALRERTREVDVLGWLDELGRDLSLALRGLRRQPGFAAVAIVTLALGIGASTAIFTVVDGVALRPLPFAQPQQLVAVLESSRVFPQMAVSWPDYLDYRHDNDVFRALAAVRGSDMILTHVGAPTMVIGQRVTANYFAMLGAKPELGRTFLPSEDRAGAPDVVVVSDAFYRSRLGADPGWLGRALELDGRARTVIGVMPPGFPGLAAPANQIQDWTPLGAFAARTPGLRHRGNHAGIMALGRLRPGATLADARADFATLSANLARHYAKDQGNAAALENYLDLIVGNARPGLLALLAAVGLLLLVACANVANLLLARAAAGHKADAVRSALGASRLRLVRQHMAESLALGLLGAGGGLLLTEALLRAVGVGLAATLPRAGQLALDGRVLTFALGLALLTTVLCGLAPALRAAAQPPAPWLGGRGAAVGGQRVRGALVAAEMALALLLLVGAGLLVRSLLRLEAVDPGFQPQGALSFIIGLPDANYPQTAQQLSFFRQAEQRLARLPGVAAVGGAFPLPFSGLAWQENFQVAGRPAPAAGHAPATDMASVRGDYFGAMGMRLLRGRAFTERDNASAPAVVIVDDALARGYFPGPDPLAAALGQRLDLAGAERTIVGVVAHVQYFGLNGVSRVESFIPQEQSPSNVAALYFVLRTRSADPLGLRAAALAQIQAVDPDQPATDLQTMDQRLALSLAQRRLTLWLMGAFALLALALAAIGIYGVLSYAVSQRTHEIGVRMALGADRGRVLRQVLAQGLRWSALGAAAGLAAALALGGFAATFLYGIPATDPLTLLSVPLLLLAIAALACYLPARRATRVDPLLALRE